MTPKFEGGNNIAMKVPSDQYVQTVMFYENVLGLERIGLSSDTFSRFKFGPVNLWIDKVPDGGKAEIWLEIMTDSTENAAEALARAGVVRCDEVEELDERFDGFWIKNPASIIHLVGSETES